MCKQHRWHQPGLDQQKIKNSDINFTKKIAVNSASTWVELFLLVHSGQRCSIDVVGRGNQFFWARLDFFLTERNLPSCN